jgi:hypothetical protein
MATKPPKRRGKIARFKFPMLNEQAKPLLELARRIASLGTTGAENVDTLALHILLKCLLHEKIAGDPVLAKKALENLWLSSSAPEDRQ